MQDKEFAAILQEEPMQPLALVPLTEEEQVCASGTLTNAYLQMLSCLRPIVWYLSLMQIQLTDVPVSSHSSHSSFFSLSFSPALSTHSAEELLHVCEQCGSAEAHGKGGGWWCRPSRSSAWARSHTRWSR